MKRVRRLSKFFVPKKKKKKKKKMVVGEPKGRVRKGRSVDSEERLEFGSREAK